MSHKTHTPREKVGAKDFFKDFIMGGTTGAFAKTLAAPIERVKLLLQVQKTMKSIEGKPYTGILNCFYRIFKEEGFWAYWKGNLANCIRYFPTTAINFGVKDSCQKVFLKNIDPNTQKLDFFVGNLLSGGVAGAIGLTVVYSLDFARTRLAADIKKSKEQKQFNGLFDCYKKIWKTDGILGLYRGFGISVVGIFIYRAFYFGLFDTLKRWIWGDAKKQAQEWFIIRFLFAQTIVIVSETISFPIDTVRRRLMMQSGRKGTGEKVNYKGTVDCFQKIYQQEGFNGFFKGNLSNIWRSVGSSLVLVLYDKVKQEWLAKWL